MATNAVLESKGARVGLITTQGFGQILHLARSQTPGPLAGWIIMVKPDPPASLADTREAVERMDARGETLVPVDREQVAAAIRDLVGSGVESLTVSLINAYVDGRHEREIAALAEELYPGFPVTISSDVLPEFREYERTLTACMNSYVRPQVAAYVDSLQSSLQGLGVTHGARHPALGRGRDDAARGRAQPRLRRALGAERRRGRRAARGHARRLPQHPHVRHGRHVDRRLAVPVRRADDRARDDDRPVPDQGAVGRRAHRRRRAAARSPTCRS